MTSENRYSILSFLTALLAFMVVVLGAYTRLSDAGLGCPDWPGCFGEMVVPEAHVAEAHSPDLLFETGKAWKEMVHRYFAGTLGGLILILFLFALIKGRVVGVGVGLPTFLLGLVIFQALLGMWTVTLKLHPLVVMGHLMGGLITLSALWVLFLKTRSQGAHHIIKKRIVLGVIILLIQIVLGGWTSANYSALACPDFPTCLTTWWPQADYAEAFWEWKSFGPNYEGGLHSPEARVAIHWAHRLGALVTFIYLVWMGISLIKENKGRTVLSVRVAMALLSLQVILGVANVVLRLPMVIAVLHNAVAALLLLSLVTVLFTYKSSQKTEMGAPTA